MAAIRPATDKLLIDLFGRADVFTHWSYDGEFTTFHVPDYTLKPQPNVFTGLCLSELHAILQDDSWTCCMHTPDPIGRSHRSSGSIGRIGRSDRSVESVGSDRDGLQVTRVLTIVFIGMAWCSKRRDWIVRLATCRWGL